uniref:Vir34 protein n=2 Tax=Plasmodium vivax TaxID=5855 RepID=Q9N878_PLAVI|nr:vir34 [Plasmodium vivax]
MTCITPTEANSANNVFDPKCGTKVFVSFLSNFNHVKGDYLEYIKKINDPILRHIFIYFVQYYVDGYNYYHDSNQVYRSAACSYLRHWLQEKKDLFTYGGNCSTKKELWDNNIINLLDMLKNKNTIPDNKSRKPWCDNIPLISATIYPHELFSPNCEESIPQESIRTYPIPLSVTEKCECPQNAVHEIPSPPDQASEADRTKNLAVTSGFTAVGTLGTLFFLYRFTPMASWFRRTGMNNVGTDLYMDAGAPDGFLSMQNGNGGNNLFYQP